MFDLDTSEETEAVTSLGRTLGIDVLSSAAQEGERSAAMPDTIRQALFNSGLTVPIAERFGGGGAISTQTQLAAIEALSYGDAGLTMASAWSGAAAFLIAALGTDAQCEAWLPRFATDAAAVGAVALYEGHGRSPSESATTITRHAASGPWVLKGKKLAVANADLADPLVVVAVDETTGQLRAAVLTKGHPGVSIDPAQRHIALDAARLCTVSIDAEISDDAILGSEAELGGMHLAVSHVRLLVAAAMLGAAQRAVDYAAKYANERIAFGKPISAFQGVSFMLADAAIRIGTARLDMIEVAARIDAQDDEAVERRTTQAVNYAAKVATEATRDALQVLGGHGFTTDHPIERWYRTAAALAALDFDPLCSTFEPAL
jgi:alkylation response protein AidB-like acyl-CoA dehydrogenase